MSRRLCDHDYSIMLAIPRKFAEAVTGYDDYRECRNCGNRVPASAVRAAQRCAEVRRMLAERQPQLARAIELVDLEGLCEPEPAVRRQPAVNRLAERAMDIIDRAVLEGVIPG